MISIKRYSEDKQIDYINDLFSSPFWIKVLENEYKYEIFTVSDSSICANLPFAIVDDLKGKRIISLPFSDYIQTQQINQMDFSNLINKLADEYPDFSIILKTTFPDDFIPVKNIRKAYYHIVNTTSIKEIENNFSSAFKRGVRKAIKENITIKFDESEKGLEEFYKLYSMLRIKKFHNLPQPYSFFQTIFDVFIKNKLGFILKAVYEKKTIATLIALSFKNVLYYKFGASDPEFLCFRPNNLLFHKLFQYSFENNFNAVNLGLTGSSNVYSGLLRFKESMGGQKHDINYFRIDPKHIDPSREEEVNRILRNLTNDIVQSHLNTDSIDLFSKLIYKNFA